MEFQAPKLLFYNPQYDYAVWKPEGKSLQQLTPPHSPKIELTKTPHKTATKRSHIAEQPPAKDNEKSDEEPSSKKYRKWSKLDKTCKHCQQQFLTRMRLEDHEPKCQTSVREKPVPCFYCFSRFKLQKGRDYHMKHHHARLYKAYEERMKKSIFHSVETLARSGVPKTDK